MRIHAAVHLEKTAGVFRPEHFPQGAQLRHLIGHEFLTAEAGLHGHDENHVAVGKKLPGLFGGGTGLQGKTRPTAQGADFLKTGQGIVPGVGF